MSTLYPKNPPSSPHRYSYYPCSCWLALTSADSWHSQMFSTPTKDHPQNVNLSWPYTASAETNIGIIENKTENKVFVLDSFILFTHIKVLYLLWTIIHPYT